MPCHSRALFFCKNSENRLKKYPLPLGIGERIIILKIFFTYGHISLDFFALRVEEKVFSKKGVYFALVFCIKGEG